MDQMDTNDISSAAEERNHRKKNRSKSKQTAHVITPIDIPDVKQYQIETEVQPEHVQPQTLSLTDFAKDFPHTQAASDSDNRPVCSESNRYIQQFTASAAALEDASVPSSSLVTQVIDRARREHVKACKAKPEESVIFQNILAKLWRPMFYIGMSDSSLHHIAGESDEQNSTRMITHVRKRELSLPLMRASLESLLLSEAGRFRIDHLCPDLYDFPACVNGEECVGMKVDFDGAEESMRVANSRTKGVIFTSLMYPDEWESFVHQKTPPLCIRPCIACCRYILTVAVLTFRSVNSSEKAAAAAASVSASASASASDSIPNVITNAEPGLFQLYRNLVDAPDGYSKEFTLLPKNTDRILVSPIVMLSRGSLRMRYDSHTGRRYLDQNRIIWQPPAVTRPKIGQCARVF
jgi:hypothetical protein